MLSLRHRDIFWGLLDSISHSYIQCMIVTMCNIDSTPLLCNDLCSYAIPTPTHIQSTIIALATAFRQLHFHLEKNNFDGVNQTVRSESSYFIESNEVIMILKILTDPTDDNCKLLCLQYQYTHQPLCCNSCYLSHSASPLEGFAMPWSADTHSGYRDKCTY